MMHFTKKGMHKASDNQRSLCPISEAGIGRGQTAGQILALLNLPLRNVISIKISVKSHWLQ